MWLHFQGFQPKHPNVCVFLIIDSPLSDLESPAPLSVRAVVRPRNSSKSSQTGWLLVCVCPLSAPARPGLTPGQLSSPTWTRPRSGCLPQSAYTLAEAEGGSVAGAVLRHGLPQRNRIGSLCLLKLFSACAMWRHGHTACTHSTQQTVQGGRATEGRTGEPSGRMLVCERSLEQRGECAFVCMCSPK
jgi:hypothetical protein